MEIKTIEYFGTKVIVYSDGSKIIVDGKERKQNDTPDGYKRVSIKTQNGWTTAAVHRLVALAFVHNPDLENKTEINHKDYNRSNNDYRNLEWTTHTDNIQYSIKNYIGRYGSDNPNYGNHSLSQKYKDNPELSKLKQSRKGAANGKATVIYLYYNHQLINRFNYIGECARYLVESKIYPYCYQSALGMIYKCRKNNKAYKGYQFITK